MNYDRIFNSLRISLNDEISQLSVYLAQHFDIDPENVNIFITNFFEKNESETNEKSYPPPKCYERSFASHPKAKFWSVKNQNSPRDMYKGSVKKCWFNCLICKHEFKKQLASIKQGGWCPYCPKKSRLLCKDKDCVWCLKKSFLSHPKAKCWSEKNKLKPRNVCKSAHNKIWFDCIICKHEFKRQLHTIKKGRFCPYCSTNRGILCKDKDCKWCLEKSFLSHEKAKFWSKKNDLKPRNIRKHVHTKIWFDCTVCKHEFKKRIAHITAGAWCPFCAKKGGKVCGREECGWCRAKSFASEPQAKFWSKKNEPKPINIRKHSGRKFWFDCNICHHEFKSPLFDIVRGKWCPQCKHKTELKLYEWLIEKYSSNKILREYKPSWCKNQKTKTKRCLPFDFLIEDLNLIIELDGPQHFIQMSTW